MKYILLTFFFLFPFFVFGQNLQYSIQTSSVEDAQLGNSLSWLDDLNGDGYAEFAVGAPGDISSGNSTGGKVYIYNGTNGSIIRTIESPTPQGSSWFGFQVIRIQDRTNDGIGELLISAPFYNLPSLTDAGLVFCFNPVNGTLLFSIQSPLPSSYAFFGYSISEIGDTNLDSIPEIGVGEIGAGLVHIFYGSTLNLSYTLIPPISENCISFGHILSGIPDVNQDNCSDIIAGAYCQGDVFVFSGSNGSVLGIIDLGITSIEQGFGYSVLGIPDVNNDGKGDFLVGAPYAEIDSVLNSGKVYLMSGSNWSILQTFQQDTPTIDGWFGLSMAYLGDINQDGVTEIGISSVNELQSDTIFAGKLYIFSVNGNLLATINPPEVQHESYFGFAISGGVNLTGTTSKDIIVSSSRYDSQEFQNVGKVFVYEFTSNAISDNLTKLLPVSTLNLYPNPFNHQLSVQVNTNSISKIEISLVDIQGRELTTIYKGISSGNTHIQYPFQGLSSGTYFVRLRTENSVLNKKVLFIR